MGLSGGKVRACSRVGTRPSTCSTRKAASSLSGSNRLARTSRSQGARNFSGGNASSNLESSSSASSWISSTRGRSRAFPLIKAAWEAARASARTSRKDRFSGLCRQLCAPRRIHRRPKVPQRARSSGSEETRTYFSLVERNEWVRFLEKFPFFSLSLFHAAGAPIDRHCNSGLSRR